MAGTIPLRTIDNAGNMQLPTTISSKLSQLQREAGNPERVKTIVVALMRQLYTWQNCTTTSAVALWENHIADFPAVMNILQGYLHPSRLLHESPTIDVAEAVALGRVFHWSKSFCVCLCACLLRVVCVYYVQVHSKSPFTHTALYYSFLGRQCCFFSPYGCKTVL